MMKIQFLLTAYLPDVFGGAEIYTRNLARELQARGHNVSIATLDLFGRHGRPSDESYEEVPVHRFAFDKPFRPPPFYAVQFWPGLYDEVFGYMRRTQPDVVHVTNAWFMAAAGLAAACAGVPVVGTHVDFLWTCKESHLLKPDGVPCSGPQECCRTCFADLTDEEWQQTNDYRSRLTHLLAAGYAVHHCPSSLLVRQIRSLGVPDGRIERITHGVPDGLLKQRHAKSDSRKLRLGFVGRWNRIKGIGVLLDAMALLKDKDNVVLSVFGEQEAWNKDSYGSEIAARILSLPNVTIRGRFDPADVARVHGDIDCLVTPSIWPENAPIAILESLALGTPVLCADGEGMTNFIRHGVNGMVFRSRDVIDLADKITMLADSPQLLQRLQQNAVCLRTIRQDAEEFERIYSGAQPMTDKNWLHDSEEFVQAMRFAETVYLSGARQAQSLPHGTSSIRPMPQELPRTSSPARQA